MLKITADHIETALKTVTETSLAGVNLHPLGEKTLDDIGGLADAKKILLETMLWPAKVRCRLFGCFRNKNDNSFSTLICSRKHPFVYRLVCSFMDLQVQVKLYWQEQLPNIAALG